MKKSLIVSTLSSLILAGGLAAPVFAFADGSVHFQRSQPIILSDLNPQPLPPGRHGLTYNACLSAAAYRRGDQPPDPCLS